MQGQERTGQVPAGTVPDRGRPGEEQVPRGGRVGQPEEDPQRGTTKCREGKGSDDGAPLSAAGYEHVDDPRGGGGRRSGRQGDAQPATRGDDQRIRGTGTRLSPAFTQESVQMRKEAATVVHESVGKLGPLPVDYSQDLQRAEKFATNKLKELWLRDLRNVMRWGDSCNPRGHLFQ